MEIEGTRRVLQQGQHYRRAARRFGPRPGHARRRPARPLRRRGRGERPADALPRRHRRHRRSRLPASFAQRLGIDYRKGEPGLSNTANGLVPVYRVNLDTVRLGAIELHNGRGDGVRGGPRHRAPRHELPQPRGDEARGRHDDPHPALLSYCSGNQRNEAHRQHAPLVVAAVGALDQHLQVLDVAGAAHRDHHAAAGLELLDQRRRHAAAPLP